MQKFEDLRFSIGLFFLIVGVLLLIAGLLQDTVKNAQLDYLSGISLVLFGAIALTISVIKPVE
jgi:hypothetical protein